MTFIDIAVLSLVVGLCMLLNGVGFILLKSSYNNNANIGRLFAGIFAYLGAGYFFITSIRIIMKLVELGRL